MPDLPPENIYGHTKKLRYILARLNEARARKQGPISLLDFGCGNGSAVSQFLIMPGVEYIGIDIHPASREYASLHYGGSHARFLETIPSEASFDVIVYADVLEHLDDPISILREH
ncbi:MAG TPA: class I SAM-dependent methyltransferase, partial [Chthonomonadales bacterium]|nr:class I SAM-dependent methyltransferase [Chthonomonadales bacterium]